MQRVAVIGNSGGGKSTLSRQLAARFELPCTDLDCLLWLPGWQLASEEVYRAEHAAGRLPHPPAGIAEAPPIHGLFKAIWENDQAMPEIRALVEREEGRGKRIFRLTSVEDLDGFLVARSGPP